MREDQDPGVAPPGRAGVRPWGLHQVREGHQPVTVTLVDGRQRAEDGSWRLVTQEGWQLVLVAWQPESAWGPRLPCTVPWETALAAHDVGRAWQATLRLLGVQDHTPGSLTRALRQRGIARAAVATVLERAAGLDYLSTARVVAREIERAAVRGDGPAAIRQRLAQRGLTGDDARTVLTTVRATQDVTGLIATTRAHARRWRHETPATQRQRCWAWLARKGHDPDTCRLVANAVVDGAGAPDEADEASATP